MGNFNFNTPGLFPFSKDQPSRGRFANDESTFDPPMMDDPLGMGLSTMHNLPPPPRCAPAAAGLDSGPDHFGGSAGRDSAPPRLQFNLTVLTSDSKWETLTFTSQDDLDRKGSSFLREKGLKAAFQSGLVQKMHSMISSGQISSSVDI